MKAMFEIITNGDGATIAVSGNKIAAISAQDYNAIEHRIGQIMSGDNYPRWRETTETGSTAYDKLTGMEVSLMFIAIEGGAASGIVCDTITRLTPEERWWLFQNCAGYTGRHKAIVSILGQ